MCQRRLRLNPYKIELLLGQKSSASFDAYAASKEAGVHFGGFSGFTSSTGIETRNGQLQLCPFLYQEALVTTHLHLITFWTLSNHPTFTAVCKVLRSCYHDL